jgi:hypothetical protein
MDGKLPGIQRELKPGFCAEKTIMALQLTFGCHPLQLKGPRDKNQGSISLLGLDK